MCLWGPDKVQRRLLTFLLLCIGRCLLLLTDFSGSEPPGWGDRQMVALKAQWLIKHQALKVRGHWPVISHPRSKPSILCPKEGQFKPTSWKNDSKILSFYDCSSESSTQGSSSMWNTPKENSSYAGIQEIRIMQIRAHCFTSSELTGL